MTLLRNEINTSRWKVVCLTHTLSQKSATLQNKPTYQEDATVYVWFLSWMKILLYGSRRDRFSLDAEIQITYVVGTVYHILFS